MDPKGKRVVITGGGSGIGLALAKGFAAAGAQVIITGRNGAKLEAATAANQSISGIVCDVTDNQAIEALRDQVEAEGGCDVLINNAGVMHTFDVTKAFPLETQLQEVDIDVNGPVRMVHYFLPGMLKRESTLVNVSSGLAFIPYTQAPVYSATKAFLHAYTQGLRAQLAGTSVRVLELMPPVVDTKMVSHLDPSIPRMSSEKLVDAFMKGFRRDKDEITPGISGQLKLMRRLAPGFIFSQLNKQPRGTSPQS